MSLQNEELILVKWSVRGQTCTVNTQQGGYVRITSLSLLLLSMYGWNQMKFFVPNLWQYCISLDVLFVFVNRWIFCTCKHCGTFVILTEVESLRTTFMRWVEIVRHPLDILSYRPFCRNVTAWLFANRDRKTMESHDFKTNGHCWYHTTIQK